MCATCNNPKTSRIFCVFFWNSLVLICHIELRPALAIKTCKSKDFRVTVLQRTCGCFNQLVQLEGHYGGEFLTESCSNKLLKVWTKNGVRKLFMGYGSHEIAPRPKQKKMLHIIALFLTNPEYLTKIQPWHLSHLPTKKYIGSTSWLDTKLNRPHSIFTKVEPSVKKIRARPPRTTNMAANWFFEMGENGMAARTRVTNNAGSPWANCSSPNQHSFT